MCYHNDVKELNMTKARVRRILEKGELLVRPREGAVTVTVKFGSRMYVVDPETLECIHDWPVFDL